MEQQNNRNDTIKRLRDIIERVTALTDRLEREREETERLIKELDKEVSYGIGKGEK